MSNIETIDIDKLLAESKRTRLGLEGSSYVPHQPAGQFEVRREEYVIPSTTQYVSTVNYGASDYGRTYQPSQEVKFSGEYRPPATVVEHSETVKRAGLGGSAHSGGSLEKRLLIIMLGTELERMFEIGRDVEYRFQQLTMEVTRIRETLRIKETEIYDLRSKDNSTELRRMVEEKEKELMLLRSNPVSEQLQANPELDAARKRLKKLEFDVQNLNKDSAKIQAEIAQIAEGVNKNKNKPAGNRQPSTAWCC